MSKPVITDLTFEEFSMVLSSLGDRIDIFKAIASESTAVDDYVGKMRELYEKFEYWQMESLPEDER